MIQQTVHWVQSNVPERTTKQQLSDRLPVSGLPPEAQDAVRDLPNGEYSKEDVIDMVRDILVARLGGAGIVTR